MTTREDSSVRRMPALTPEPPAQSVAAALVAGLAGWGLRHVFIVPGQQIDPLNRALSRSVQLRPVVANHELAAGYMADAYARASGGIGACFAIGGPGAANLVGAAVAAKADRSPVLFVTGLLPAAAQAPGAFQDGGPLAALIAFVCGGAGGALYTLAMIEIGHRHEGTALVNATAVLVLSYTVGAMLSPALGAAALQWAPGWGFPALLAGVAALALVAMTRR
jgi:hypothetical protein